MNSNWSYSLETPNSVQNQWFFYLCELEIWQMTLKNNRAPLLWYFKLCASFRSHWWIQTGVTVRERPIWVKIHDFILPCDLEFWQLTLKNNRAPLLSIIKLCTSFHHLMWIWTRATVQKWLNRVLTSVTLTFWLLTLTFSMVLLLPLVITKIL